MTNCIKPFTASTHSGYTFKCVACGHRHMVTTEGSADFSGPLWGFNGDLERPTFTPSLLVTWREPANLADHEQIQRDIRAKEEHGTPIPQADRVCHSFIADGRMQYLGDCTHHLAGQTVDLPPLE